MSGHEDLVDPPVMRRPLPFSRAWLAAFVLAVIAVGWVAAVDRFDAQAVLSDGAELDRVVTQLEAVDPAEDHRRVSALLVELERLLEAPASNDDPLIGQVWQQVSEASLRAEAIDPSDAGRMLRVVTDLRAAADQLQQLTARYQNSVSSSDSISRSPS
ncbi:MAG: hypothetical protein ACFCVC_10465 [Acidimicrobiia bacterium]